MSARIKVAIIGSGLFVQEAHLPAVQACADLSLHAIYSRSLQSAQKIARSLPDNDNKNITLYSEDESPDSAGNYEKLLSNPAIQAVIIALPITVQPEFIKKALKANKHVLAEKPLGPDLSSGKALVDFYDSEIDRKKINFSIGEQIRFLKEFQTGSQRARELGEVMGCRVSMQTQVLQGSKYYETPWRKNPAYQGGFLLDGGVHMIAGMRLLLGHEARVVKVSAQTALLQDYLPPVDTLEATLLLANGCSGTLSLSFGTTFRAKKTMVACREGVVKVTRDMVTVRPRDGEDGSEDATDELGGVKQEVFAWAKSLVDGKWDPRQSAEEALADLEIVEACLKSGERKGEPVELKYQL